MTATNSDNIISHISRAYVEERISKKTIDHIAY